MPKVLNSISDFFRPLSTAQKTLFGILTVGVLILVGLLFHWALQPSYAVLFQSLSSDSAQNIVKGLESSGVPYQLADNGHTIRVPRGKVYNLRLKYADSEVSNSDYKGFKLFDNNTLGMTDFMQRINKKRALEGELARTINSLTEVKSSRVHIVLPKRTPFKQSTVKASASVVLNMKSNSALSNDQIDGITALIAGSVAKLKPEDVVILDQSGNELTKNTVDNKMVAASSEQMRVREEAEQYLKHKGQSMLDRVVGPGNSILRVSTDLNFNKVTSNSNTIDPSSRTIISEEQNKLTKSNKTQQGNTKTAIETPEAPADPSTTTAQQHNSMVNVKNYVVSRTKKHFENTVGDITHISASVLLNYKAKKLKNKNGAVKTTLVPHSKKEVAKIKRIMYSALGLQSKRGDVLTIKQVKFQDAYNLQPQPEPFFGNYFTIYEMIRWILVAIVAAVIGYLMYRTSKKMKEGNLDINNLLEGLSINNTQRHLEDKNREQEKDAKDLYTNKLSEEAREQLSNPTEKYQDIDEFVEQDAPKAARLVRKLMDTKK
jgi:flagellar M-ring protein FliF